MFLIFFLTGNCIKKREFFSGSNRNKQPYLIFVDRPEKKISSDFSFQFRISDLSKNNFKFIFQHNVNISL